MKISRSLSRALFAAALVFSFTACPKPDPVQTAPEDQKEKSATAAPTAPPDLGPPAPEIDPCALISDDELEAITGVRPESKKPSQNESKGLRVSQCYVQMPTAADSIVFALFQRGDVNAPDPRRVWEETFDREAEAEREREGEEEKELARPEKLEGVGDEAFIMPQRFGAAIYVLKGRTFIRLSIGGGPGDVHEKKIETLKKVAETVLGHL